MLRNVLTKEQKTWLLAAGAVSLAFLLLRKSTSSPDADTDALTQMLLTETDFASTTAEMAQIVYVALNRAKKWGVDPATVVTPPGAPGVWNSAAAYSQRFYNMRSNPKWDKARAFVQLVQSGAYANYGKTMFLHPGGMPTPPCTGSKVVTNTIAGSRCLPTWAVNGQVVGKAMFV